MICYKDMTFCDYDDCQKWHGCYRQLTPEVVLDADKKGLLIAQFADKPDCWEG